MIRRPETDPADLHIPFTPSEVEGFAQPPLDAHESAGARSRISRRACPVCGSEDIRPSLRGAEPPADRFDVKTAYRCVRCNASFKRTNPLRVLVFTVILFALLGGLSYLALAALGARRGSSALPMIKRDQIKEPPPPVFR